MATLKTIYNGQLRTEVTHLQSGNKLITDAPTDNNGRGEFFSPTDMVAAALGSCMLTIMGMVADRHGVDLTGTEIDTDKVMYSDPRRIGEINMVVTFPEKYDDKIMTLLERAALTCPVYNSLGADVKKSIVYKFK